MMNNTKAAGASPAPVGKEKQIMMATTTTATKTPLNQSSKGTRQKVTIIPIANQISETQQAGNHDKLLTNGMETKYVILPKLESSPNRRRRFIKSQSTDPNSLVTCQTDFKFIAPNRSSMPTTQTISHNVNHNETHITPIQQNDVSISAISQTVESSLNNEELKPSSSLISIKSRETDLERQNRAEITKCLVEKESVL
uniref:Uncharacterized protein n=1 Tax=Trichobilharzia regenti TaxID=157069 RepID=A0AA85JLQ8_TRIRE|nr:unnamed protein product [Trichobilharzia regenti]